MARAQALTEYLDAHRTQMIAELEELVRLETPSGDEAALSRAADVVARRWEGLGAHVRRHLVPGVGVHLEVTLGQGTSDDGAALVLGHLDTVYPVGTLQACPFRTDASRAYGPGAYDMKAGLVMMAWAVQALDAVGARPRRRVRLLVTADEEVGSGSSRALIERAARGAALALVLEPAAPGGAVKTARKGVARYRLTVTGKSAHAGNDVGRGVSAIVALAQLVLAAHGLSRPSDGTTVNVGVVGGGTRPNVVPERAWADVDVRFVTRAEAERVDRAMRALAVSNGARVEVTGGVDRWPLERTEAVAELYRQAREAAAELGIELAEASVGGASDGNITAELGLPTLDGLGPVGDGAHSAATEYVDLSELPRRTALLACLLERL